ncbi:branched-chain amino acid aminotransferase [Bizionia argentinensis JUB59]|uniref:Branched-chain-amino-acid aminotransferase n=1 Tax=Bizionia argentinensis JUB59 TaxID=1046627 RepID=G2EF21_9FLAO|nr:branched-chain amino acid aminotransferase [Bizionia argentinensis]EGV42970.1 branched-chain amino acid aminotransferase [Bizionia argentinensis JUB59]
MIDQKQCEIDIEKVENTKIHDVDFDKLDFGRKFTDHMFYCDFIDDEWQQPKIVPYQAMTIEPSARVLHYGQAVFEGMKAYKDTDGNAFLFRPEDNHRRINISAARLAIPEFPKDYFMKGLTTLIEMDKDWIKSGDGNSLYIRPFVFAIEPAISAAPAEAYRFMIICSPAKAYYTDKVRVIFAEEYSRSANGGVGFAKAAGNYAAQFYPTRLAQQKGYQQVIWTDANTHEYLEEAGTMNIFFRINDTLVTAPISDRILDGITRKSIIQLAEDNNIPVEVRRVKVSEIKEASRNGSLKEIFGTGTAAVISAISAFEHGNEVFEIPDMENAYADLLKKKLVNIQQNQSVDKYGWRYEIK